MTVMDAATLKSARRLLDPDIPKEPPAKHADLEVCCTSQVLEALVLFDAIEVPDIDASRYSELTDMAETLGTAVQVHPVSKRASRKLRVQGKNWLAEVSDVESLIELVGATADYHYASSSDFQSILLAFGVQEKYSLDRSSLLELFRRSIDQHPHLSESLLTSDDESMSLEAMLTSLNLPRIRINRFQDDIFDREYTNYRLGENRALIQLCIGLAWAAYRVRLYEYHAVHRGVAYIPHPLRASISGYSTASDVAPHNVAMAHDFARTYLNVMEQVYDEARAVASESLGLAVSPLAFSPLLPHIAQRAYGNRDDLLPATYDLRESKGARSLRASMAELQHAVQMGNLSTALDVVHELQALAHEFRRRLGLESSGKVNCAISLGGLIKVESPVSMPRGIRKLNLDLLRSPRITLLRNAFADLSQAAALGPAYDIFFERP